MRRESSAMNVSENYAITREALQTAGLVADRLVTARMRRIGASRMSHRIGRGDVRTALVRSIRCADARVSCDAAAVTRCAHCIGMRCNSDAARSGIEQVEPVARLRGGAGVDEQLDAAPRHWPAMPAREVGGAARVFARARARGARRPGPAHRSASARDTDRRARSARGCAPSPSGSAVPCAPGRPAGRTRRSTARRRRAAAGSRSRSARTCAVERRLASPASARRSRRGNETPPARRAASSSSGIASDVERTCARRACAASSHAKRSASNVVASAPSSRGDVVAAWRRRRGARRSATVSRVAAASSARGCDGSIAGRGASDAGSRTASLGGGGSGFERARSCAA